MTEQFDFSQKALRRFHASYTLNIGGCWLWHRGKLWWGHGRFNDKMHGRAVGAHRYMYALANGPIPDGKVVMHECDTPACVNPDHLRLGTPSENSKDCTQKGRRAKGSGNGRAKLTDSDVAAIRLSYKRRDPECGAAALGRKFGVSSVMISLIARGKNWRNNNGQGTGCASGGSGGDSNRLPMARRPVS